MVATTEPRAEPPGAARSTSVRMREPSCDHRGDRPTTPSGVRPVPSVVTSSMTKRPFTQVLSTICFPLGEKSHSLAPAVFGTRLTFESDTRTMASGPGW